MWIQNVSTFNFKFMYCFKYLLILIFKFKIITLRDIKSSTINLIPINWALKQLFTRIDRFLNDTERLNISWSGICGYFKGIRPIISCYFHGIVYAY